jgi:hypothetical protein
MSAAYSTIEAHGGGTGSATTIVTGSATWTTGREIVLTGFWDNGAGGTSNTPTSSGGSITWTQKIADADDTRHGQRVGEWRGVIVTGFTGTLTYNLSASSPFRGVTAAEVSGARATQYDTSATDLVEAGTPVDLALTTTQDDCLCIASFYCDSGSDTWTSNPTNMTTISNFAVGQTVCMNYRTTNPGAGATTVDFTLSSTGHAYGCGVAIASAAGAVSTTIEWAGCYPMGMMQGGGLVGY